MANSLTTNPIRLDTTGSTNLAQTYPIGVHLVTLEVASSGGTATIEDAGGNSVLLEVTNPTANSTVSLVLEHELRLSNNGSTSPGWKLTSLPTSGVLSLYWH